MRIHSMTATFGKLEHETLTLKPGLNIIEAPNEWGKSTWCAFLINMLYGIETRVKTTKNALADKERYAPWSGSPMAGRIDLNWNGRDITIERSTKGRVVFGDFRAYETETGMDIPELNGVNCGQMLLGVERSVFARAGFLKLSDLPVTQDDSLRRRLNNLVTTGDENGAGDKLQSTLKDLKNKCRYNRSGLLPQAENEREVLRNQLADLHSLKNQAEQIRVQQTALEAQIARLENHADALRYAASQEDARKVTAAGDALAQAEQKLVELRAACEHLPPREDAQHKLQEARALQEAWMSMQMEAQMLPPAPEAPQSPARYRDGDAIAVSQADSQKNARLEKQKKRTGLLWILYAAVVLLAAAAMVLAYSTPVLIGAGIGIVGGFILFLTISILRTNRIRKALQELYDRYPGLSPDLWVADAQQYAAQMEAYQHKLAEHQNAAGEFTARRKALDAKIADFAGDATLSECQAQCSRILDAWDALGNAQRDLLQLQDHARALQTMARTAQPPKYADDLQYTAEETDALLTEARFRQRQLHTKLGQCLGQTEALGQESLLKARLDTLNRRIARLEDTYYALEMAQDALHDAANTLQRRFAPRISKRAQNLFERLTGGRYQRITLGEDLSLSACAEGEDVLHSSQWRSDGTVDQLYLALRLAVAEELTPEAPLVLDDALVRFDDARLAAALKILQEEAQAKQVILFTCQSREADLA